jgi:hypothetical protein
MLWVAIGRETGGHVTFPVATDLARRAATGTITPEQMLTRAGLSPAEPRPLTATGALRAVPGNGGSAHAARPHVRWYLDHRAVQPAGFSLGTASV